MHGYKNTINWGALRETYASALIYESKIIEHFQNNNTMLLWDPFCGCGTIPIEAFFFVIERNIRPVDDIKNEAFTYLSFHDKNKFKEFLHEQKEESENYTVRIRAEETNIK